MNELADSIARLNVCADTAVSPGVQPWLLANAQRGRHAMLSNPALHRTGNSRLRRLLPDGERRR